MAEIQTIEDRIASGYDDLSAKLRSAADFVARNPVDFATRSLRSVAGQTGLAPATFSRLSRALGFDSYEDMREVARTGLSRTPTPFAEQAGRLQSEATNDYGTQKPFLQRQSEACMGNIERMIRTIDQKMLNEAVDRLSTARSVTLVGSLGSAPFADYCSYLSNWFVDDWSVAGRTGRTRGATVSRADENSAFIVISKRPYVRQSLAIAALAAKKGAYVIVLTDSDKCPALKSASAGFILPTESPQFFSSYAATLVLIETIIGMLVARAGPDAKESIEAVEINNRRVEEFRVQ